MKLRGVQLSTRPAASQLLSEQTGFTGEQDRGREVVRSPLCVRAQSMNKAQSMNEAQSGRCPTARTNISPITRPA